MPSSQKYTDEYLEKELLNKAKELGRTPTRKEVKCGHVIAKRFGNGKYNDALIYFGLKPNFSRYYKKTPKETLNSKINGLTCIEVYEMVLKNEIKQFPSRFWQDISDLELKELLKYFFETKLEWTIDDIKNNMNSYIFGEYKLSGMAQTIFEGSPFKVVDFTYPNKIKEWELNWATLNYWTMDKCIEVTKEILKKEEWTEEDIKTKPVYELLKKYGVTTIYVSNFNGTSYNLINAIYPNKFKPWEILYAPKNYWNVETGKQAIKWMIEEKLKWTTEDIKEKYGYNIFKKFKLNGMLNAVFKSSPYKAINATYPNRFKEEDFKHVPINYWKNKKLNQKE